VPLALLLVWTWKLEVGVTVRLSLKCLFGGIGRGREDNIIDFIHITEPTPNSFPTFHMSNFFYLKIK
jgi:hypothetical protein